MNFLSFEVFFYPFQNWIVLNARLAVYYCDVDSSLVTVQALSNSYLKIIPKSRARPVNCYLKENKFHVNKAAVNMNTR